MKPLDQILAATDLSAPSRHGVDRSFMIAQETGAKLTVAHALNLGFLDELRELLSTRTDTVAAQLEEQAHAALQNMLSDQRRTLGVAASASIEHGSPLSTIPALADRLDSSLIILGARGEGFLRHILLGSTVSRLIRIVHRSVLVVRQPPRDRYRHLLIPLDLSPRSEMIIRTARRIAPSAEITLLHAFDVPFEGKLRYAGVEQSIIDHYRENAGIRAKQQLRALAAHAGLQPEDYTPVVALGDPTQQILLQEQERDCDLIVMGKHDDPIKHFLLGSVTKHILSESQSDILIPGDPPPPAS